MKLPGMAIAAATVLLLLSPCARAQGEDGSPVAAPNLELLQGLLQSAAGEIASRSHVAAGDTVELRALEGADGWVVENSILRALKALECTVMVNRTASPAHSGVRVEIGPSTMGVRYDQMFRDGFFGAKKVRRRVSVSMTYQTVRARNGEILAADILERASTDTVAVDDVARLEDPTMKSTRGELPSDQFLDKVVEPFIIIGATGVAVYLLFHVRS